MAMDGQLGRSDSDLNHAAPLQHEASRAVLINTIMGAQSS
jgi:hypothetical protein